MDDLGDKGKTLCRWRCEEGFAGAERVDVENIGEGSDFKYADFVGGFSHLICFVLTLD